MTSDDQFKKFLEQNSARPPVARPDELDHILARARQQDADPAFPKARGPGRWSRTWEKIRVPSLGGGIVAVAFTISFMSMQMAQNPILPTGQTTGTLIAATPTPLLVNDDELSEYLRESMGLLEIYEGDEAGECFNCGEEYVL